MKLKFHLACPIVVFALLTALSSIAAPIPGLFNTGVGTNGALLASGSIDPHWRMTQSADAGFPGPNAIVLNDTGFPIGSWLQNGPTSKWLAPQASQAVGNAAGDYRFRTTFDLTGLEPTTAVVNLRVTSDNGLTMILVNGVVTGLSYDGNFAALSSVLTINSGFVDGTNTLDFIVNNAGTAANPIGFRCELSGTADLVAPPGTPPTILSQPASGTVGFGDAASFSVSVYGSKPFTYQWRKGGAPIAGGTSGTYSIANASPTDVGSYDVVVGNSSGSVTSSVAMLNVVFLSPQQLGYEPLGPSGRRTGLAFSEIMYHPKARADLRNAEFIEIYNSNPFFEDISGWRLSGAFDFTFPSNTVIRGRSFLVVAPSPADVQAVYGISGVLGGSTNNLPNEGGTIRLTKRSGGIVLEANYSDQPPWPVAADGAGHSLVLARPSYGENSPKAWAHSAALGGSPGASDPVPAGPIEDVVFNEILAHTDPPLLDAVELYNHGVQSVDLSGCWLTDDPATNKFRIPDNTTLEARGFVAFNQDQLGFALSASGETVFLVNSNQTRVIDAVRFGGQANGVSSGRYPDGAATVRELGTRTLGAANAPLLIRDVVINEILFNPLSGDSDDEFVELHNRGASPVSLAGWQFVDGINFNFPPAASIPAGGFLVVARNAARLRTNYAGLNSGNLLGDFGGNLSNGGERLALAMPDYGFTTNGSVVTTNVFHIVVDEVTYGEGGRWGRWADGGGSSLELIDARSDHRLAPNWADSDETAKAPWTVVQSTGTIDLGFTGVSADQLQVFLQGAGEALVDDVEVLVGGVNRITNSTFEGGIGGWFPQGTQSKSFLETSGGFNSARALHLMASERGDHVANRVRAPLSASIPANTANVTIRAKVRWLRGHPEILLRLRGGWLEAVGRLAIPPNPGTPGAANSQVRANAGPAITEVSHRPVLPAAQQAIRVTARVHDPDGVQSVTLRYRLDPATTLLAVNMVDNGASGDAVASDGLYTGVIPGQTSGTLVAFRLEAIDSSASQVATMFPTDAPTRECLVRVGESHPGGDFATYRFWMTKASQDFWTARERMSNEDVDATFVYGTNRVVYNAGAHYSGSSYTAPTYTGPVGALCGYDINFPDDDAVLGETHFTLDWPIRDVTNQREQLMFWFLDQYGLPNMYRRYVNMFVNGVRRGVIYDDVQQPAGVTIEEWFPNDSEGDLFKTDCWNEFDDAGNRLDPCILNYLDLFNSGGVKKAARYRWNWRPRATRGTANDFTSLFALVDAVNAPTNGYQSAIECTIDVEHWMRTFAMNDLASFWDAFGNPNSKNTYLYKPERDGWKLFCWDFDVGIGVFNDPVADALFPSNIDPTLTRMYNTPAFVRAYWRAMEEAVNSFFQASAVTPILTAKWAAFQANGVNLTSPLVPSGAYSLSIPDWITARRTFLLGQLNSVTNAFNVTSASDITTNRNAVLITGTAPVRVATITINGIAYPITWVNATSWRILVPVSAGTNVLEIAGLDRLGNAVSNGLRTVTVNYTGADELPEDNIVINEIMYNPLVPEATYIELFNRSATATFDLSGWRLNGIDLTLPPGTLITNRGYLVIAKSRAAFGAAYGWGIPVFCEFDGQLDDGGETLSLVKPGATPDQDILVDIVTYEDDPPWPALADGQGASLQVIDSNQDNNRVSNWSDGGGWRLVSYTANPGSSPGIQFSLFLTNIASDVYLDDISLVQGGVPETGVNLLGDPGFESPALAPWSVSGIATNSAVVTDVARSGAQSLHLVFVAGSATLQNFFQYLTNVVATGLTPSTNHTLSFWMLPGTNSTIVQARINSIFRTVADARPSRVTPGAQNVPTASLPPFPALWLSEVQPNNVSLIADNLGDFDPWIELYNGGTSPLSLDGYYLANSHSNLTHWAFPPGSSIEPGQFLLIWADGEPGESTIANPHASFRLNATGGSVILSRDLSGMPQILDFINYGDVGTNRSFGSYPDGQLSYRQAFYFPTPRATNDPSAPPATLFINEWMAANQSFLPDPFDQDYDDWFELFNPGANGVELGGYRLTDDLNSPNKFIIPAGFRIAARGFLLVWADEEGSQTSTNGELHVNFRLSQGGETLGLLDPAGRVIDAVMFAQQSNNVSEGRWPDGAAARFFMPAPTPRAANVVPTTIIGFTLGPASTVTLTWSTQPGARSQVQYKNDLNAPEWTNFPGEINAIGNTASFSDTVSGVQRFYRVVEVE